MEIVLDHPHLVDSLRFRLGATRSTQQAEVRITVAVVALVSAAERDSKALDSRVLAALKELIAVPWSFSHVVREPDAAGFERIKLRAAARVPRSENWNLTERARKVSREGLSIAVADVSYAMSGEQLSQVVSELRLELLRDAGAHARSMSEASGRHWRVGDVEFGVPEYGFDRQQYTGKGASRDPDGIGDVRIDFDGGGLTSGERVTMFAAVTLKADTGWREGLDSSGMYVVRERQATS